MCLIANLDTKEYMMDGPNIFDFATSELSQGAFLYYMLSFGKEKHKKDFKKNYRKRLFQWVLFPVIVLDEQQLTPIRLPGIKMMSYCLLIRRNFNFN